jgi:acyl-CoA thioesterase-2
VTSDQSSTPEPDPPSDQQSDPLSDPQPDPQPDPLSDLLHVLALEELGSARISVDGLTGPEAASISESAATVFLGASQRMPHGRVFGGQVLAQCVIAAGRTVQAVGASDAPRLIHSLHGYFMRPGDDSQPIRFAVERMRDGRSFSTRRVHAIQNGLPILSMITSFQQPAGGLDHQEPMPDVPEPSSLASLTDAMSRIDHPGAQHVARRPIEHRHVEGHLFLGPASHRVAEQSVWLRAVGTLPDDPLIHAAVLAYASDYTLLEPVIRQHGLAWSDPRLRVASLDHAMWFHRTIKVDDWILYTQNSPSASGGRGLSVGRMFAHDGTLVATVAQEGMLRIKEPADG